MKVSRHPIGRAEPHFNALGTTEGEDAAMLEKTVDDTGDADVIRDARKARSQTANAANQKIDLDAGLTRRIQRTNDHWLDERVHLRNDPARLALLRALRFAIDELEYFFEQPHRCHGQT